MTQRKKVLNYWNVFNTSCKSRCWSWWQLQDASCMEKTSRMHCSGVILAHSSIQSSNLEVPMGFFYKLWSLVLIFYWIQVRWLAGPVVAALFSFSETIREFPWLCVWDHCLAEMSTLVLSSSSWYCRCWDWTS